MTRRGGSSHRHWFLVGFSGAGKSTVGPLVAAAVSRDFIDLDTEIEHRAGRALADLIPAEGEAAFRAREHAALAAVLEGATEPLVVALGGGAPCHAGSARVVAATGDVAWLDVPLATCLQRLGGPQTGTRPLLAAAWARGGEGAARALHAARRAVYARVGRRVDASGAPRDVALRVVSCLTAPGAPAERPPRDGRRA